MKKVFLHREVIASIDTYISSYLDYYVSLYSDTGIFSEEIIIEQYQKEARERYREIRSRITEYFSPDIILGRTPDNTLFLPWRSKTLFITWEDE